MAISKELLEILVCPLCKAALELKPGGTGLNSSTTSVVMTGSWSNVWLIRSPSTGTMLAGGVPRRSLWK